MIFLTVGTQFSFDRLVRAIDEAVAKNGFNETVFAQIGQGSQYKPQNIQCVAFLQKEKFDEYFTRASSVVSHGGMGTITMALEHNKPLLIMPRLKKYGEVVNDHQLALAREFEAKGQILVAYDERELPQKLKLLKSFVPKPRQNQAKAVADRIAKFLEQVSREKYGRN